MKTHYNLSNSRRISMNVHQVLSYIILISIFKWNDALLCYSCTDLKNNEACFNITACPDGEACYGRADGFQSAEVKHTTGCTKELKPPKRADTLGYTFCAKACQGDLCNLHSCQLGNTTRLPPRCLSCDFVDSPRECKNLVKCRTNEVCFSEKITTFQKTKYRFGCVSEKECDIHPISSPTLIGRSTEENICSVCCKTDHCNLNACSHNSSGQMFRLKSMSPGAPCTDTDPSLCTILGQFNTDACKEPSVIKACPKSCVTCGHVGWNSWQPWSSCSKTCNTGTMTRSRVCNRRFSFVGNQTCVGSSVETIDCSVEHCPENGKWCYDGSYSECRTDHTYLLLHGYDCSYYRHKTTCDCPAPKYGGACLD